MRISLPCSTRRFMMGGPVDARLTMSDHADVVVMSRELNDKVFGGANSVGKTHQSRQSRISRGRRPGPLGADAEILRSQQQCSTARVRKCFYPSRAPSTAKWPAGATIIVPATSAAPGWEGRLHSECIWLQFWAELPTRRGRRALPRVLEQLCGGTAAHRPLSLAAATRGYAMCASGWSIEHAVTE